MVVYSQNNTWLCFKHGEFASKDISDANNQLPFPDCPRCAYVKSNNLCIECEKHKATVTFALSTFEYIHGLYETICVCCHFKRVEKNYQDAKQGYEDFKAKMEGTVCE